MDAPARRSGPITGVILAAGSSVRMGRAKQLLPLGAKPVLQHVIDATVAAALDDLVLVLGHHAADVIAAIRLPPNGRTVTNPDYREGMASSLVAGVRAAGAASVAIAVLLGDEPQVSASVIDLVLDAYRSGARPIARAVYSGVGGVRTPGHPVVIDRSLWPEVERLRGDEGMRAIIAQHREWVQEVDITSDSPLDLDTWEQYERVRRDRDDG